MSQIAIHTYTLCFLGVGTSLIITQCEYLIRQYFQEKYKVAKNVLYLSRILGYVVTPLVMGNLIIRHGVLECMIVYQVILGQVIIVAMTFKKPYFIIPETTAYNILDVSIYIQGEEKSLPSIIL